MKDALEKQESLARYLNMLSQNDSHFDKCSKKIQDVYRKKAGWVIDYLASLDAEKVEYCEWERNGIPGFSFSPPHEFPEKYVPKTGICSCGKLIRIKEQRILGAEKPQKIEGVRELVAKIRETYDWNLPTITDDEAERLITDFIEKREAGKYAN